MKISSICSQNSSFSSPLLAKSPSRRLENCSRVFARPSESLIKSLLRSSSSSSRSRARASLYCSSERNSSRFLYSIRSSHPEKSLTKESISAAGASREESRKRILFSSRGPASVTPSRTVSSQTESLGSQARRRTVSSSSSADAGDGAAAPADCTSFFRLRCRRRSFLP